MRILSISCVFPNPAEPGLGLFTLNALEALAAIEEVRVVAPIAPFDYDNPRRRGLGRRSVPALRRERNLEVRHPAWLYFPGNVALNGIILALNLTLPLYRLRRSFRFELIDAHFGFPEGVAAWILSKFFRCPYVIRMNGNELVNSRHFGRRALMRRALRGAGRIFALSGELRQLAVELGADPGRITLLSNGVDASLFHLRDRAKSRQKLGLDRDRRIILCAGRLVEVKGLDYAVRALAMLRGQGEDVELALAGEAGRGLPSAEPALRRLASSLKVTGAVRFLGWTPPDALAEWMSAADVLCLPSLSEGCPNVVIEAMACGCPVVASDVGMVGELVSSEQFGAIVPPADAGKLTSALADALHKNWDRQEIAKHGQSRTWRDVAQQVRAEMLAALAD